jgi:tRNA(adenine34) deaminase
MNTPSTDQSFAPSRRWFFRAASVAASAVVVGPESIWALAQDSAGPANGASPADRQRMRELAAWTALTFDTPNPVPYGADILDSRSGERLMRAANAVGPEHDPSAHAELRTIRLACAKLASGSLKGYTLYTTCEPCPMCMACALWAGMDRVVYGATIADASKTGHQIHIPAKEVARHFEVPCVVDGPVEREACVALFTDPRLKKEKAAAG